MEGGPFSATINRSANISIKHHMSPRPRLTPTTVGATGARAKNGFAPEAHA